MSDDTPKIRDRLKRGLSDLLQSSKPSQDKLSKKTKISGTVTPPGHSQIIIESPSEARSQGESSNESYRSVSAGSFRQTLVMPTEHTAADTRVGNPEKQPHDSTATSVVNSRSLWTKAFDSNDLDEQRRTLEGRGFRASALECVSEARGFVENILKDRKAKPWKIDKLLNWMDKFKEIGDIVVQYDPVHAALPWAAFRLLLKLCVDRQKTLDPIVDGLENIAGLIQRCTIYEILYLREDSDASRNLEKSMLQLYIAILKFLAKAIDKAKENHVKAVFTTESISDYLGNVKRQEKTVKDDADVVGAQATRDDFKDLRAQLKNMNDTVSHIQDWLEDKDRSSILQWISTIPYISHHKRISEGRLAGTGEWLFDRPEYEEWITSSESKLLLLRGIPNRREPESILNTIIQQLAQCDFEEYRLAKPVVDVYQDRKRQGQESSPLSLAESQGLLIQLTDMYPETIICIDALDEVAEDKRIHLLKALNAVIAKSKSLVKIFATTRQDPDIVAQFKMFPRIELKPDDNVSDINQFVKARVQSAIDDGELLSGKISDEFRREICDVLCTRSKGMFQLAALQITFLCQLFTEDDVRRRLPTIPDTLKDAYNDIYCSITSQKESAPVIALNAFRWIKFSYEPLRSKPLLDAISVEVGKSDEFSRKAPISTNSLLKICRNLLIFDEGLDVFRFAHLSVQEFLETQPELNEANSHTEIAKMCLSLLCAPVSWNGYAQMDIRKKRL
ncbi:hypothetical protein BZA77DRAFT_386720 [Pyronema omphalodes]|nr:hypothetical protein BZA77DRAFT_386720 [Pyronema omphalodes]